MQVSVQDYMESVKEQYEDSFDTVYKYLDEGNDKHELVLMVMELMAMCDEGRQELINDATNRDLYM